MRGAQHQGGKSGRTCMSPGEALRTESREEFVLKNLWPSKTQSAAASGQSSPIVPPCLLSPVDVSLQKAFPI